MREAPGPALCRLRTARSGALLPAGAQRAPHGCGASAHGGASVAGVAAARTASRGRAGGGFTARVGFAARPQALPLAVLITGASEATSAPGVARVRAPPGGTFRPPPSRLDGGGTQPERLGYIGWAGGAPAALAAPPPPSLPPGRAPGQGGAAGGRPQVPQAPAGSPGGRNTGGGGAVPLPPLYLPPLLLPGAGGQLTVPRAWVPAPGVGTGRPPRVADSSSGGGRRSR